jgi:hypothetical protein
MSLIEHDSEIEEGSYGDFKFALKVLYEQKTNKLVSAVVYLKEKNNRIPPVEVLIDEVALELKNNRS